MSLCSVSSSSDNIKLSAGLNVARVVFDIYSYFKNDLKSTVVYDSYPLNPAVNLDFLTLEAKKHSSQLLNETADQTGQTDENGSVNSQTIHHIASLPHWSFNYHNLYKTLSLFHYLDSSNITLDSISPTSLTAAMSAMNIDNDNHNYDDRSDAKTVVRYLLSNLRLNLSCYEVFIISVGIV